MSASASRTFGLRDFGYILAVLALWVKLAVPLGFMPADSAAGPVFQICSAVAAPPGGESGLPGKSPKAGMECAFSLLHASAVAAAEIAASGAPLGRFVLRAASPKPGRAPLRLLFAPPPPSHAPPGLVA